jgi:hypothetical protein
MSAFLDFCDKHKLHFDIGFRYRNEGEGRFYLHFSGHNKLQIFNGVEMERVSFVNGDTPSQALKNAEQYFKGRFVSVHHLDEDGEWKDSLVQI